jgi:hypothetical protein
MLPSFRLIVATFLGAFVLASVGLHLAASSRTTPATFGTIGPRQAGTLMPMIFDLRFSADLTAIAAIPARLPAPTDNIKSRAKPPMPAPATEPALVPSDPLPAPAAVELPPQPDSIPAVEVFSEPDPTAVSPLDVDTVAASAPTAPAPVAAPPSEVRAEVTPAVPDGGIAPAEPVTTGTVTPAPPAAKLKQASRPVAAPAKSAKAKRKARLARRPPAKAKQAAPDPFSSLFGSTAR